MLQLGKNIRNLCRSSGIDVPVKLDVAPSEMPSLDQLTQARVALSYLSFEKPDDRDVKIAAGQIGNALEHFSDSLLDLPMTDRVKSLRMARCSAFMGSNWLTHGISSLQNKIQNGLIAGDMIESLRTGGQCLLQAGDLAWREESNLAAKKYRDSLDHFFAALRFQIFFEKHES